MLKSPTVRSLISGLRAAPLCSLLKIVVLPGSFAGLYLVEGLNIPWKLPLWVGRYCLTYS